MRLTHIILVALLLIISSYSGLSCICTSVNTFEQDVEKADFIAYVEVTALSKAKSIKNIPNHNLHFKTLNLYKGNPVSSILVFGGNRELNTWTSCDLGERVGEKWVLFAKYDEKQKRYQTGYCRRNKKIEDKDGFNKSLIYPNHSLIKDLEDVFDVKQENDFSGHKEEYFSDGGIKLKETYKEGVLDGERILYYPNGRRYADQNFSAGIKQGEFIEYTEEGIIRRKTLYNQDIPISDCFYDRDSGHVKITRLFNSKGEVISEEKFFPSGKKKSLRKVNVEEEETIILFYSESGNLRRRKVFKHKKIIEDKMFSEGTDLYSLWQEQAALNGLFPKIELHALPVSYDYFGSKKYRYDDKLGKNTIIGKSNLNKKQYLLCN